MTRCSWWQTAARKSLAHVVWRIFHKLAMNAPLWVEPKLCLVSSLRHRASMENLAPLLEYAWHAIHLRIAQCSVRM